MASVNKADSASRPSWSKIAASGYLPPNARPAATTVTSSKTAATAPQTAAPKPSVPAVSTKAQPSRRDADGSGSRDDLRTGAQALRIDSRPATVKQSEVAASSTCNDDGSTQVSSDDSAKLPNFDTKSILSTTTYALDEKESLRPDDSASIRAAIEEEEAFSAPGSVMTGSRVGSDFGIKHLREQVQGVPHLLGSHSRGAVGTLYEPNAPTAGISGLSSVNPVAADALPNGASGLQDVHVLPTAVPDDKLMDALQSQRDRLWVLKLEQDIIDFVGQSKEASLTLPQCNAFYRMLAHKLADYYKLDHAVAQTTTGAAVVISRTSFSITPPPLSGISIASNIADTPPLIATARKIMRRAGDPRSENTTAANSEGPSASVSELGIDNSAMDGTSAIKLKAQLTREEREKQYAEVRERIFGKTELADGADTALPADEVDQSRSSSAAGKKKPARKQRNLSNDDFEPRSQFPAYYTTPQHVSMPASAPGQQYLQHSHDPRLGYPNNMYGAMGVPYGQGYPVPTSPHGQASSWSADMQAYSNGHGAPAMQTYDMSAHMQTAMQFQPGTVSGGFASGVSPEPFRNPYPPGNLPTSPQMQMPPWQQPPAGFEHDYYDSNSSVAGFGEHGVPAYFQHPFNPQAHGNFAQLYRPQFNPQTQAFVPSGPVPRYDNANMGHGQHQFGHLYTAGQAPRHAQPNGQSSTTPGSLASPRSGHVDAGTLFQHGSAISKQSHNHNKPSATRDHKGRRQTQNGPNGTAESLEITAKFGMPAHLPPRPPAPQSTESLKNHEASHNSTAA